MKKILFTIALLIGTLSSCSGFLDEEPKGNITTESYYKTQQHAISATNAIYDFLIIGYAPGGLWDSNYGGVFYNDYWVLQDLFADNATTNLASVDYQSVDNMQIDQYNLPVQRLWRDFYQTIKACNVVLDRVPPIEMDANLKKHLLAEARFFRAMMYFDLVRMFGDVPLHKKDVETSEEENIPRSPRDEVYEFIIADLKIAEQDLTYAGRMGGGHPYTLSASALLARVYLTYGALHKDNTYFQLAAKKADEVIPHFPMLTEYGDLFKIANRFNSEIIYGVNFNGSLSAGWKGGQFLVRLLPKLDTSKGGPDNAQGWESATENLYSTFSNSDKRKDVTLRKSFVYDDGSTETFKKPYFFKYWDRQAEPKGNTSDAIFPAIRTAEMYLIKAEALNEINHAPNAEALAAVKVVRDRAGLSSNALPSDYAGFKKALLNEYRLEFSMEGRRWFDLTRMCTPQEFIDIIKTAKPEATPKSIHFLFPIPQYDRELSHGVLTQNEGY
ncbi:SusD-like starch-binding protein associating with outer membrane [Dysgonomonas alginatilytica]|uniref:SusD-like starch-binding protein associating with outer membrane n=1 Tax=Dysgonomonas alginatilytica TaxID=1605892 RepID=A0A2V3PIW8_9BACT|nr:RagB/SusD family nutrient uptake outer membrane protein [Dysgonomonas alginatilytica]PXV59984.1 SusD-like starch-binding protein associating with outer membrane [Dysgonomonas alginatilytica]